MCSVLALESCKGYIPNTYHMWCCTARQCNILYTQQAIEDLGYDTIDVLEYITCVGKSAGDIAGETSSPPADHVGDGHGTVGLVDSGARSAPVSIAMHAGSWLACVLALVLFTYVCIRLSRLYPLRDRAGV